MTIETVNFGFNVILSIKKVDEITYYDKKPSIIQQEPNRIIVRSKNVKHI